MKLLKVSNQGLIIEDKLYRAALGRSGLTGDKREGDGGTPVGRFALRKLLYRPDRLEKPKTFLNCAPIEANDGWCDDPKNVNYNRPVKLPYPASAEQMWREDGLYDLVVVLGHNDDPPVSGLGSAIFFHLAGQDYAPTAGCVAVSLTDMLEILAMCEAESWMEIG
jgi:L,D-peptidoglycan transpeptidase YkuD (ErfK/YbiS/YcfS/YnhG family)